MYTCVNKGISRGFLQQSLISDVCMGKDIRGVERGACSLCSCKDFVGRTGTVKCGECGHVPGAHQNRDVPDTDTQPVDLSLTVAPPLSSAAGPSSVPYPTVVASTPSSTSLVQRTPKNPTMAYSVCSFPGCGQETTFDCDTGEEYDFCRDHIDQNGTHTISGGIVFSF